MSYCKHIWYEIESDNEGIPTKYVCKKCLLVYIVKGAILGAISEAISESISEALSNVIFNSEPKLKEFKKYFDKMNSILNRINENEQKINILNLGVIGFNEKLLIKHLKNENENLKRYLKE